MIGNDTVLLDQIVSQRPGHIVSDMGGEMVMLSVENGKYYNLGAVGGRIWELAEQPTSVSAIVSALIEEYEVEQSACEDHVLRFIGRLSGEGLLKLG